MGKGRTKTASKPSGIYRTLPRRVTALRGARIPLYLRLKEKLFVLISLTGAGLVSGVPSAAAVASCHSLGLGPASYRPGCSRGWTTGPRQDLSGCGAGWGIGGREVGVISDEHRRREFGHGPPPDHVRHLTRTLGACQQVRQRLKP